MGVVTVSSSAARTPLRLSTQFSTHRPISKKPLIVSFKEDKPNKTALVAPHEQIPLPIEARKEHHKRLGKANKPSKRVKAAITDEASTCTLEVDYNEAAAKLENIYKLSPMTDASDVEDVDGLKTRGRRRKKKTSLDDKAEKRTSGSVVRSRKKMAKRLSLDKRIELKKYKVDILNACIRKRKDSNSENEKIENLVREYSASTDLVSLDWKKMKIPPVLPSTEHAWLFKLMQPLKVRLFYPKYLKRKLQLEGKNTHSYISASGFCKMVLSLHLYLINLGASFKISGITSSK